MLVFEDAKIRHTLYHRGRIVLIALADTIKEVMFVRYVRGFIFRVSGRRVLRLSRITRGQGTWHHTQSTPLGQTISTSDTTVYGSLVSEEILLTPHVGSEESRADVWLKPLSKHGFLNPTECFGDRRGYVIRLKICFVSTTIVEHFERYRFSWQRFRCFQRERQFFLHVSSTEK